jgi:RHS repeat-associated protein
MQDVFDHEATIEYDDYQLLPVKVTDPVGMETSSEYDYRVLQPERVTDPNLNISTFAFTPLGLMHKTALLGKGDNSEGDTLADPGVLLEYDLFAFKDSGAPVWVKTTQRVHHINADYLSSLPSEEQNATIVAVEYSDGFGRQLQTRTQAEDLRFGDALLGDSGLPADQGVANAPAVGTLRTSGPLNVVVSGAKLYNNKGEVVEQWEPYFGSGFDLTDPMAQHGQRVRIYFDALGRPKRTVNPDGTEQRVVYGVPNLLNTPDSFKPSPWERFTYDANDLAGITHPNDTTVPVAHRWTPKSEVVDALGRTVRTTEHLAHYDAGEDEYQDVVMQYTFDIKGQLLKVTDPLGRVCFEHVYDTAGNNLWTKHLDSGEKTLVVDAQGKPLYSGDVKGAAVYTAYDDLHRPTDIWAKDATGEDVTLRQHMVYGDAEHPDPAYTNHNGQLWKHYDEAGFVEVEAFDFKGNPLEKRRLVINDDELAGQEKYVVDWTDLDDEILDDEHPYVTSLNYDGLNRVRFAQYPKDVEDERKILIPTYNRAGALEQVELDGTTYIEHIAYNAKGQRLLMAMGNGVMTRYAYDPGTFRLMRIRSERYSLDGTTYEAQSGTTKQDCGYEYDLGGNILKIKERVTDCGIMGTTLGANALDRLFTYDPLKRLLSATGRESDTNSNSDFWVDKPVVGSPNANHTRAYTQGFEYDKVGNILQLAHAATGNSYTRRYNYASGLNHLASIDNGQGTPTVNASFIYDDAGNQIQVNTDRHFEWDGADQLRYFKREASGSITSEAHYLYAGGQRMKKYVRDDQGNATVTVYIDGVYEHRYRKDSAGGIELEQTVLHVMDGRSRVAITHLGDEFGDFVDENEPTHYNLEDHLGTSMTRLDLNGTVLDRMEYYPFGDTSMQTAESKRYRYVGKELDSETGLHYYGARYYAAWSGRFISVDPLAHSFPYLSSFNYAGNKPIGDFDIDGMQSTGDPPVQKDPRVRSDGRNVMDAPRAGVTDAAYEISNLPSDPVPGQVASYHYTEKGDSGIQQVDWVYDQESDKWGATYHYGWDMAGSSTMMPPSIPAGHTVEEGASAGIKATGDAVMGASGSAAKASSVRAEYVSEVAALEPLSQTGNYADKIEGSQMRNDLVAKARARTPEPFLSLAKDMKPTTELKPDGRFWVTNAEVNSQMSLIGKVAKVGGVIGVAFSVYNIAEAENKPKQVAIEVASAFAAIEGAKLGAMLGTMLVPGVGTIVGGILGGLLGAVIAGGVTDFTFELMLNPSPIIPRVVKDPYDMTLPSDWLIPQRFQPKFLPSP